MLPMTREWVAKAESDYDGACEALRSRKKSRRDRICFFSQQCVEKYLKARLTEAAVAFPRTQSFQFSSMCVYRSNRVGLPTTRRWPRCRSALSWFAIKAPGLH